MGKRDKLKEAIAVNEDLRFKIIQKSMQRTAKKDLRDDEVLESDLREDTSKKEKKKKKKRKSKEFEETYETDPGFKDFCRDLTQADNVDYKEKPTNDNATEVASKAAEDIAAEVASEVPVSDNAVLRKLLRGPRYFDPPDNSWGACYNCGEEGHTTVNCTAARRKRPCFVCGCFEHSARQCSKGRHCFICKQQGHQAKDCPERNKISKICLKCGDIGHEMFSCKNDYFPDDLKEIQCYMCGMYGHLCCKDYADLGPREVSCYRCGLSGHTGLACSGSRSDTNGKSRWDTNGKSRWDSNDRSRWDSNDIASAGSCYKCGIVGHFARECTSSVKASKRNREPSTPKHKSPKKKRDHLGIRSAPHDIGKMRKKKKSKSIEYSPPAKTKTHRGGWITDDLEGHYSSKRKESHWRSPATPRDRKANIHISYGDYAPSYSRTPGTSNYHYSSSGVHHHTYSASRYGCSSNGEVGRNNDRW